MFKDKRTLVLVLGIFALLIGGVSLYKTRVTSGETYEEEFHQRVRNALAELNFSTENSPIDINKTTNNLANFIYYRSGIQLSQTNKDSLSLIEQKAQAKSKKIPQAQLADILTTVASEKLVTLSDSDIDAMADSLRGFNTPEVSANFPSLRMAVKLRSSGEGRMEPASFIAHLKEARTDEINYKAQVTTGATVKGFGSSVKVPFEKMALRARLNTEIRERSDYLAASSPDFFNGSTNNNLTPTQAILLTYSIITNDMLAGNQSELQSKMNELQQIIAQHWGRSFPNPQNHHAYGVNGYLFSTPTNLLFDDATVARVLNFIEEKGNL